MRNAQLLSTIASVDKKPSCR